MPRDCVHGCLARKCELCDLIASENELVKYQKAVIRWVRADRAWTLCQGSDPSVQKEMDEATYALHNLADALEGERAKLSRLREAMTAEADIHDENLRGLGADYCECPFCKMALEGR